MAERKGATRRLEAIAANYPIYHARRQEFNTGRNVPFRVAPTPFHLTAEQKGEIQTIGADVTSYFKAVDELYRTDETVRAILNTGKPEIFLADRPTHYLFVRPDLIITPSGFSLCEIETSPFGLGLAEMLNRAYQQEGHETLVADGTLPAYVQAHTPTEGTIIYSQKTGSYQGQLTFLADEVFSSEGRAWQTEKVNDVVSNGRRNGTSGVYRGVYLGEYVTDASVRLLFEHTMSNGHTVLPSATPHMEEKAVLSFLWDTRYEQHLRKQLGDASFNHLREVIPPTFIVGQERYFAPGMPDGVSTSVDLASLSRSKRTLVLKESGFGVKSSWAEGVGFLHEKSSNTARELLQQAQDAKGSLFVVQQFHKAANLPMQYEAEDGSIITTEKARVRLTPYFSMAEGEESKLLAVKVTGCENTDLIHGSSTSINTAVS